MNNTPDEDAVSKLLERKDALVVRTLTILKGAKHTKESMASAITELAKEFEVSEDVVTVVLEKLGLKMSDKK